MPIRSFSPRYAGRALGVAAALILCAGCSGSDSQRATPLAPAASGDARLAVAQVENAGRTDNSLLPPNSVRISVAPSGAAAFMNGAAVAKPLIFVSDAANGVVKIYPQAGKNQKLVGRIAKLAEPQGLTTDAKRNLYVANTNGSNVLVYAPPYGKVPVLTLADTGEFPADVAVSAAGIVAVTNICSAPSCPANTGSVSLYAKGSTTACTTVSDATYNFARVMFASFDRTGTLYIDGMNSGYQTSVGVITGGCNATSIANLGLVYTISFPGGVAIDKAGRIAILDPVGEVVDTFNPPSGGQLGEPTSTTALTGSASPLGLALLAAGKDLYTADSGGSGVSNEYAYTAGGKPVNTIAVGGQPVGIAVTPPIQP
jgi:hypothetical protein